MSIQEQIAELTASRQDWVDRRQGRLRGSSAHKRITSRIRSLDKKLGYLRKCAKRAKERDHAKAVQELVNG